MDELYKCMADIFVEDSRKRGDEELLRSTLAERPEHLEFMLQQNPIEFGLLSGRAQVRLQMDFVDIDIPQAAQTIVANLKKRYVRN